MYLKSLEMQGFKSFPDHILIEFHQGITAIVGPNGSGKSNVTDAIRWVLGEQSARSLRGSKMEDVIFNGTSDRRRLASAEVSITFDNKDHRLPIDYETVVVTRRYYRSGESEYLINRIPCRLKDITELFADTGIGRDGYSIIGQGKVDDILSDRSDDRRKIFDEAAGIVKFKMRKADSQRKLEKTEQNLLRIHDLVTEIEDRIGPLKAQAEDAKRYEEYSSAIKSLDLTLSLREIRQSESAELQQREFVRTVEEDLKLLSREKDELYAEREQFNSDREQTDAQIEEKRTLFRETGNRLAAISEEAASAGERRRIHRQRLKELAEESEDLGLSRKELEEKIGDREQHTERLRARRHELSAGLSELEEEAGRLDARLGELEKQDEQRKQELNEIREELFTKRSRIFELRSEREQLQLRKQDDSGELHEASKRLNEIESRLEELGLLKKTEEEAFNGCMQEILEAKDLTQSVKAVLDEAEALLHRHENSRSQKQFLLSTLRQLEDNREGYHQAVKEISREAERNPDFGTGLHGPLAELIRVSERYETAIETSMGQALHNLVCDSHKDASRFIRWLKDNKAGRETFLPLDHVEGRGLTDDELEAVESCPGFLGTADEFIEADPQYDELLLFLGGRIVLADSLRNAIEISKKARKRLRVVSLDGDVVNPGGSMTGGSTRKGLSGLLSRAREIDEAEAEIADLKERIDEDEKAIEKAKADLHEAAEKEAALGEKRLVHERQLVSLNEQLRQEKLRAEEILPKKALLDERLSQSENRSLLLEEEQTRLEAEVQKAEAAEQVLKDLLSQAKGEDSSEREKRDALRERIADLRVSLGSIEESLNGIFNLKEQLEAEMKRQTKLSEDLVKERASIEHELSELEHAEQTRDDRKAALEKELSEAENSIQLLQNKRLAAQERESGLFARLEDITRRQSELQGRRERAEAEAEHIKERLHHEKNRIWETYQLSYHQAEAFVIELPDEAKAQRELKSLRNKLRSLPAINHSAPQEYEALSTRYDFILEQRADIEESKQQLETVIRDLEKAMREQFRAEFDKINLHFQTCFAALFNGGRAELIPGEGDLLECPIEIKAQPPGKRLQSLTLLSGGERALTAIALLFAIFELRPAPFCVLDEVESALDDANVIRFTDYIRHYTEDTQFILVTHRKGTMEAAERLYGVTMKERGVSTLLSMKLGEAEE